MTTVAHHLKTLKSLQKPSGLFTAAAHTVSTGYDKAWLRDNFYTALAFEEVGDIETVQKVWKAILGIFLVHEDKITWATKERPYQTWQYIHARFNPETFEEYWEEWGNKQNDAVGAILFKLAELHEKGYLCIESPEEKRIVQKLVDYLASIEYWHDPDNGVWEEYEEVHASSVGPCVAGLKKIARWPFIQVPERLIEKGEHALRALLPRESVTKFADLALLSLIYPYKVVTREEEDAILANVTYHLERDRGVIRYKNDRYYNKNSDGYSEEAEWTFGFPWLALIYHERGEVVKAHSYLEKALQTLTPDGLVPELYYSNSKQANENTPLGWSESLLVVAMLQIDRERFYREAK